MTTVHTPTVTRLASPLNDANVMIELVAQVTGRPPDEVQRLLQAEYARPGITVAQEFHRRGLTPYILTEGLERFYSESDAFIFESAVWNRNRAKAQMRRWIGRHLDQLAEKRGGPLDVLCIGDGLGFDSASLAVRGHHVTYHEVPGPHEAFARAVFERAGVDVRVITQHSELQDEVFDVVVCLDVLEHVPDPQSLVAQLVARLRRNGRLVVHAPFYMIHPAYPTHLKRNRAHSGSLQLYLRNGLQLIDGKAFWNPLVFQKADDNAPCNGPTRLQRYGMVLAGAYFFIGRFTALLHRPIHLYRRALGRWFG